MRFRRALRGRKAGAARGLKLELKTLVISLGFIEDYLNDLDPAAPPAPFPASSQIKGELRELQVRFANLRYRVIYQRSGNLIVLLHAFEKTTGATPLSEIEAAEQRMLDFRRRMDAARRTSPRAAGRDAP